MLLTTLLGVKQCMNSPVTLTHLLVCLASDEGGVECSAGWGGHAAPLPLLGGDSLTMPRTRDAAVGESREGDDQRPGEVVSRRVGSGLRLSRKADDLPCVSLLPSLSRGEDDHRSLPRGADNQLPLS